MANIALVHDAGDVRFADRPGVILGGAVESSEPPIVVRHVYGADDFTDRPTIIDASPYARYVLDDSGELGARFTPVESNGWTAALRTIQRGHEYELRHDPRCRDREVNYGRHDRTIFAIAVAVRQRGLLTHACGFLMDDIGVLCPGLSGAGKSTLAALAAQCGAIGLSDDRVLVTKEVEGACIWGTPWMSRAAIASRCHGTLTAICFLGRGAQPEIVPVSGRAALHRLLEAVTLPYWSRSDLLHSLEFIDELFRDHNAYELRFPPTVSGVRQILTDLRAANTTRC